MWEVSRWAVLRPTPGSLLNSSMRRATGAIRPVMTAPSRSGRCGSAEAARSGAAEPRHAGQTDASGHAGHAVPLQLPATRDGFVDRGDHQVLQHLDLGRIDRRRIDLDGADLLAPG